MCRQWQQLRDEISRMEETHKMQRVCACELWLQFVNLQTLKTNVHMNISNNLEGISALCINNNGSLIQVTTCNP